VACSPYGFCLIDTRLGFQEIQNLQVGEGRYMELCRAGSDRWQQASWLGRGEDEGGTFRRLFQELEKSIGRLGAGGLGGEGFRFSNDEDLPRAHGRPTLGPLPEVPGCGQVKAFGFGLSNRPKGVPAPILQGFRPGLLQRLLQLLGGPGLLGAGQGEVPMEIGMFKLSGQQT
jgi:hypothetical protein